MKKVKKNIFLQLDIQYPEKLCYLHNDLPFLPERMMIEKVEKLVAKFFKSMNNAVSGKTMDKERKLRDIKLVATEKIKKYLVSEPSYHTTKFFPEKVLAIEIKKLKYT